MRKPSSSSKSVIAAPLAAAFGLTAGPALAQAMSHDNQSNTPASQRPASRKSATAKLNRTTQRMKQAQGKELRVASAQRSVRKGERKTRSGLHSRRAAPANTTPPRQ